MFKDPCGQGVFVGSSPGAPGDGLSFFITFYDVRYTNHETFSNKKRPGLNALGDISLVRCSL